MTVTQFTAPVASYDSRCLEVRQRCARSGVLIDRVAYGSDPGQQLDIYLRDHPATPPRAVVLAFHGGGFTQGNETWNAPLAPTVLGSSAILVGATYRKMKHLEDRSPFEDGLRALKFVRDNIAGQSGSALPIFLGGHSAGAVLATTLALDTSFTAASGIPVAGLIAISASFNRLAMTGTPGGGYDLPEGDLPVTADAPLALLDRITAPPPPFFIAWGQREKQRGRVERSSLAFAGRLAAMGHPVEVAVGRDLDHFDTHLTFADEQSLFSVALREWLGRHT